MEENILRQKVMELRAKLEEVYLEVNDVDDALLIGQVEDSYDLAVEILKCLNTAESPHATDS